MFEHRTHPLLPRRAFLRRLALWALAALGLVAVSLALGALGYHGLENLGWLDATLNAAMILTGMGPIDVPRSQAGKVFAIVYALFSGVIFLTSVALILAPVGHRILHRFHMDLDQEKRRG
jgi:hypothetical protein